MLWPVMLKVPPGTRAGQHLRLGKRGLPKPHGGEGDLFAIVQIVVPTVVSDAECLVAARTAYRLRDDFELDTQGLAVALALLELLGVLETGAPRAARAAAAADPLVISQAPGRLHHETKRSRLSPGGRP